MTTTDPPGETRQNTLAVQRFIGAKVRAARSFLGISQEQAGRIIDLGDDAFGRRESGKQSFLASELFQLGRAFGVDPEDFYPTEADLCAPPLPVYAGDEA